MLPVVRARVEGALNGFVEVWFRGCLACSGLVIYTLAICACTMVDQKERDTYDTIHMIKCAGMGSSVDKL